MNYKQDLAVRCEENLNSLSEEHILAIIDVNFKHILKLLNSSSEILFNQESTKNQTLSSLHIKILMLLDIISQTPEEFISFNILRVLLEGYTDIFQDGKSVKIETLADDTLRISAVNN